MFLLTIRSLKRVRELHLQLHEINCLWANSDEVGFALRESNWHLMVEHSRLG